MSPYGAEAADLSKAGGSLLINMGTLNADSLPNYLQALQAYNQRGNPVVLDPVGGSASEIRKNTVKELMAGGYFDLIKGNESEIKGVYGQANAAQLGVDSGPSTLNSKEKATLVQELALRESEFSFALADHSALLQAQRCFCCSVRTGFFKRVKVWC